MYLRDFARGLLRRWYIVVLGLLLTVPAALWAYSATPVRYDAQASLVLLPPPSVVGDNGNPYLNLQGLGQALEILGQRMTSGNAATGDAQAFPGSTYTAGPDATSSGPILVITTESVSRADAIRLLTRLRGDASDTLQAMQSELNVPSDARIGITDVTVDQQAAMTSKARTQTTVIVIAAGIVLTVLIAAVADRAFAARRRRIDDQDAGAAPTERTALDRDELDDQSETGASERESVGVLSARRPPGRGGSRIGSSKWPRGESQPVD